MTPYEVMMRVEGYKERMKNKRIFAASFITAPIINSGSRGPKRAVTVKRLLPDDFGLNASGKKIDHMKEVVKQAEREELKRKKGGAKCQTQT